MRDDRIRAGMFARLDRLGVGLPGDWRSVGEGVRELRIDYGPGYRGYYGQDGETLVLPLCGGDKRTQRKDIKKAHGFRKSPQVIADGDHEVLRASAVGCEFLIKRRLAARRALGNDVAIQLSRVLSRLQPRNGRFSIEGPMRAGLVVVFPERLELSYKISACPKLA